MMMLISVCAGPSWLWLLVSSIQAFSSTLLWDIDINFLFHKCLFCGSDQCCQRRPVSTAGSLMACSGPSLGCSDMPLGCCCPCVSHGGLLTSEHASGGLALGVAVCGPSPGGCGRISHAYPRSLLLLGWLGPPTLLWAWVPDAVEITAVACLCCWC